MAKKQPVRRTGGRSARVRADVEEAVRALLQRKAESDITIADIAERSGVHAASIYRRWGNLEALLLDMTVARLSRDSPMPDTGTLEGDLFTWAQRIVASVSGPDGPMLLRAAMRASPQERMLLLQRGFEIQEMLDRSAARQEAKLHFTDVVDGVIAPIYVRQMFGIGGLDARFIRKLVRRTIEHAAVR
jgi:AcrR family transcriptional regulator